MLRAGFHRNMGMFLDMVMIEVMGMESYFLGAK